MYVKKKGLLEKTMTKAQSTYRSKLENVYKRRKISHAKRHIDRLFKSVYPVQSNDYVMVKYPKGHIVPVDAPLYPVVRKLLKLGFRPAGWDFGEYRTNGGFIRVGVNPHNKQQNTQRRLAKSLSALFHNNCVIHKAKPTKPSDRFIELVYFNNDAISIDFSEAALQNIMTYLNAKPSRAQVLPGSKAAKISEKLRDSIYFEFLDNEIEVEDMF